MPEFIAAVTGLLLLGAGVAALHAVLDGRRLGVPASIAVVAPLAETVRLLRSRPVGERPPLRPVLAGAGLVAAVVLRALALPVVAAPLLGPPLGIGWLVVADLVWWLAAALLLPPGRRTVRRFGLRALTVEAPLLVALATPAVAAGSLFSGRVLTAQQRLPFAAEAPVAFLLVLAVAGVLLPQAVEARASGPGCFLVRAALAAQPVSAAAVAAVLFLGAGAGAGGGAGAAWLVAATVLLAAILVVVSRRFPRLRPASAARLASLILLPLALVQLAVVGALVLLSGAP